jgi:hypothetical protein
MAGRLVVACLAAAALDAQSIQYVEARKVWLLTTRDTSYAMAVGPDGALRNLYWGAPLWGLEDLPATPARRDNLFLRPAPDVGKRGVPRPGRRALL